MSDSIWKKEISLRRTPKADPVEPVASAAPAAHEPEPAAKESVLKKEISFRRKPKVVAPEPVAAFEAPGKTSLLKKEISFGRRKRERDDEIERLSQEAAEAFAADFRTELEPESPLSPLVDAIVGPHQPGTEPVEADAPAPAAPAPVEAAPVESAAVSESPAYEPAAELPSPGAPVEVAAAVPPELAETAQLAPVPELGAPEPAPASSEPSPTVAWAVPAPAPAPEPWLAGPELPPEPAEEPEAIPFVVHPPVPSAELPPLEQPKVPFWKKEIGPSRKPKAGKQPKQPKPAKEKRRRKAETAETTDRRAFSLPSLSLRRSSRGGHRAQRVVGLKVGTSQLAAARISNNGVAELQQLSRRALPAGIVVGGEVRDPDALAQALKSFFAVNRLPRKGVRLGIASSRIGVRIFEIEGVEGEKQLENAVRFRAQEALPIPLEEAALDYRVLDERVDEEGQSIKRVLLVVAHRELIERYVSACKKAGVALSGIDLEAFALLRSLAPPVDRDGSALVGVSIGHERTTLAVSDGRICEFTRVLEWGGSALNVALARALDSTPSEVETLKRSLSLDGGPAPEGIPAEHAAVALEAVRRGIESLARELVSSLQFYQGQPGSLGIGEIVITGGTAQMPGLAEELERLVGVRVRLGNPLGRLKVGKKVTEEQLGSLSVAIGLGIED